MERKKYFTLEESSGYEGRYVIVPNWSEFPQMSTAGSFNILCARLLNLSYADYLRFCRDICGAQLIGKNWEYPVAYFEKSNESRELVNLLNSIMNLVMWEREHPDWRAHQEYLEQKKGVADEKVDNE